MPAAVRNVLIIVLLAVVVWKVPGGGTAGQTVSAILGIIFIGGLLFFVARMYLEHRVTLHSLADRTRAMLYGSVGLATLAFAATSQLWDEGGVGVLLWFAMIGVAAYGIIGVWRQSRSY